MVGAALRPHQDFVSIPLPLLPPPSIQGPNIASFLLSPNGRFISVHPRGASWQCPVCQS